MRKIYMKATAALACAVFMLDSTPVSAQEQEFPNQIDIIAWRLKQIDQFSELPKADTKPQPRTMMLYGTDDKGLFVPHSKVEYEYDKNNAQLGYVYSDYIVDEKAYKEWIKFSYKYDAEGRISGVVGMTFETDRDKWKRTKDAVITYDDVRKDAALSYDVIGFDSYSNEEYNDEGASFFNHLKRDDKGRVVYSEFTQSKETVPSRKSGYEFIYTEGHENPTSIVINEYHFEDIRKHYVEDIKWNNCNNQFVYVGDKIFDMFRGDAQNQIESCVVYSEPNKGGQKICDIKYTYSENKITSKSFDIYAGGQYMKTTYMHGTDTYGKYYAVSEENGEMDASGNKKFSRIKYSNHRLDEHDNLTELSITEQASDNSQTSTVYALSNKYDADDNLSSAILYELEANLVDRKPLWKVEFSNYTEGISTGITEASADTEASIALSGNVLRIAGAEGAAYIIASADGKICLSGKVNGGIVSVDALSPGLYIANVGGKAIKFVR